MFLSDVATVKCICSCKQTPTHEPVNNSKDTPWDIHTHTTHTYKSTAMGEGTRVWLCVSDYDQNTLYTHMKIYKPTLCIINKC